ncbi:MAG: envelope biogenesis factor ElyC [Terriglobia bacterium]
MFLMKKIVSRFFFPVPLSLEFLVVGLFLLWFTRRQRAGKALVTCGTLLLVVLSNNFISNALIRPLEHRYPPLAVAQIGVGTPEVTFIAVLGGWADHDPDVPVTSHVSPDLMVRLIEGVRLHRAIPDSKLILSGDHDSAESMTMMAEALGVSAQDIVPLSEPRDTEQESRQMAPIVGSHRFILVTSASHMARAMGYFRQRGLQPIAAPTDYLAPRHGLESDDFVPDGYKLLKSQTAFYEYLGLAWQRLRAII